MYLGKVFIKHPNICFFPFLARNSLEMKKRLQNAIGRLYHIAN